MANKSTVANDLRRFATFFKGLTDAADTLDQMQSMEEMAIATEQRVTEAGKQLAAVQAQIADADRELVDTKAAAAKVADDAAVKAANVIEVASQQSQVKTEAMLDHAKSQAEAIIADAQSRHTVLIEQIASMGDQLLRMTDERGEIEAALDAGRTELTELEAKLTAARESIAKLLG